MLSSVTLFFAERFFKERKMIKFRSMILVTVILGVLFILMQGLGFKQLWNVGITLQKNVSFSFLYVIVGLHAAHVIGGLIALLILLLKAFSTKIKIYNTVPVGVTSTYWHFVDILWIYLMFFLLMIK
jgi:cytochrome c oxidase subunit 3